MKYTFLSQGGDVDFKNSNAWHAGSNITSYVLLSEKPGKKTGYSIGFGGWGGGGGNKLKNIIISNTLMESERLGSFKEFYLIDPFI